MLGEALLAIWSAAGLVWWIISWQLVRAERKRVMRPVPPSPKQTLTIFKPLPLLAAEGMGIVARGLESFVALLDPESELLLGVHEADRETVGPFLEAMRARYPKAQVRAVYRLTPDTVANPKIAWQLELAPHARGELWLWSDADIIAPAQFVQAARDEFASCGAVLLTYPYVMCEVKRSSSILEALFVNADVYPGVLLLRRLGLVDFGLGAAMLFDREEFRKRVAWQELGEFLADDFQLGQRLRPVRIGTVTLETAPGERTWLEALRHDLRWTKTIRWNRPGGFFARIVVLPVMGWLMAVALHPLHFLAWAGLLGMMQAEVIGAVAICRCVGCRLRARDTLALEGWSLWRITAWVLAWLPGSVTWSGRSWSGPRSRPAAGEMRREMVEAIDRTE
jgi:ceramide glucosyltransferase